MRIVYVCADAGVPVYGMKGASVHVQEVVRAMRQLGASVELVAARTGGAPPADLADVPVHLIPTRDSSSRPEREQALLASNAGLAAIVEHLPPFDLLYERYSLWSHCAVDVARSRGATTVVEVNAPLIEEQKKHRELADEVAAAGSASRAFAAADVVLAVSRQVAKYLASRGWGVGRTHVVPNGVNIERFTPPTHPAASWPEAFVVGFAGSLKPWHGLDVLVAAFSLLHADRPHARLLIVGDGPERQGVAASLDRAGLMESTLMTGAVPSDDMPGWLASMDAATAPYADGEDFYFSPLKLYEYMASGRAIAASAVGQVQEVLRAGVDGLLCQPGDPAELARALARLDSDRDLRNRLGRNARAVAERDHSWRERVRSIFELSGAAIVSTNSTNT